MRMSVNIIYNKCSECRHARPSYYASSKLFCALRGIEKKTLRRCNKWDSADIGARSVLNKLELNCTETISDAFRVGVEFERKRLFGGKE